MSRVLELNKELDEKYNLKPEYDVDADTWNTIIGTQVGAAKNELLRDRVQFIMNTLYEPTNEMEESVRDQQIREVRNSIRAGAQRLKLYLEIQKELER